MTGAQYIVDQLIKRHVTDAFGIPGGVILELLYEMDKREEFTPHLSYHEQAAGFAACGYAQASGKIGVAYATRGPGFTNLITAIADAYYDSLPTLFITAHSAPCPPVGMRVMADQEMDTCSMVQNITKLAMRLDDEATFAEAVNHALVVATEGRKGPVFLDISSSLLKKEVVVGTDEDVNTVQRAEDYSKQIEKIAAAIKNAKRPIILAGDGINQSNARELFQQFVDKVRIPVVSSRFSHDVMAGKENYYGYVGGHGMRAANFILSKTDLILSLGNRLHFPPKSESYGSVMNHAKLLRVELDRSEFNRDIQNTVNYQCDVKDLLSQLLTHNVDLSDHNEWIKVCDILKEELKNVDINSAIESIEQILKQISKDSVIVNDIGNNEFWVSRACVETGITNRVYYSKSYGALGCGLGKAIGAYYATKKPAVCFVGDQGLQINIQELQFISQHKLPITIVLLNNHSSGMIKDRELAVYDKCLHTTLDSGYGMPAIKALVEAYGIKYGVICNSEPSLLELSIEDSIGLTPSLPRGNKCQELQPALNETKYDYLNNL